MASHLFGPQLLRQIRCALLCVGLAGADLAVAKSAHAQEPTPLARVQAIGLDTAQVGRVVVHFAPGDRDRALELGRLVEGAAAFYERELELAFDFQVAALPPEHWFSEFPGVPYAIPWVSMPERLLFTQSSLTEGFMVRGPTSLQDRYRIDWGLVHEYSHVAEKAYFRPGSPRDYVPVSWFGELLANYIAYAYVHTADPEWAQAAKGMWRDVVAGYTPSVVSLDWSFMNDLPPQELARTYAWYQNLLNLRAAALYETHGLDLLPSLRAHLAWEDNADWTSASLLEALDDLSPGFEAWSKDLTGSAYLPRR